MRRRQGDRGAIVGHGRGVSQPADELIAALGANRRRGLAETEAQSRLARYGPNELAAAPPVPAWRRFLSQFEDNFASIVAAVEEGRAIFANIRKFLRYLLSSNIGEVLTMFFGVLLAERLGLRGGRDGVVLPLLATQTLWINLVTDGPPALALGVDPSDEGLMRQPPRPAGEGVLTPTMWRGIAFVGVVMAAGTLLVLDASLPGGFVHGSGTLPYAQTMAFTTLMLFQIFNVLNARSDERSAFVRPFTNGWLWAAIGPSVVLQVAVVYVPFLQRAFGTVSLSGADWLFSVATASSVLWLRELTTLARLLRWFTRR